MGNRPALASGLCVDGEVKLWRSYVSGMVSLVSGEVQPAGGAGWGGGCEKLKGIVSVSQSHQLVDRQGKNAEHQV